MIGKSTTKVKANPTPTRERVRANLERLLKDCLAEVADVVGSPSLTAAQRASNLRRYLREGVDDDARFPTPETLDAIAEALGVDVSELFKEPD